MNFQTMNDAPLSRRDALGRMSLIAGAVATGTLSRAAAPSKSKTLIGLDGHSLRAMKWKSEQLIEYAAQQKLDAVLFNGFHYFESLDPAHLRKVKAQADRHGLAIRIGAGGISVGAEKYRDDYGSPVETLVKGIEVATILGSPTVNCRIGSIVDRYGEGGIEARLEEVADTMKAARSRAEDAGVTFAFENHAADTRSDEILALIDEVGSDLCGVMLDPGNALWSMEDPLEHLKVLGPHVRCMSIRDYTVWAAPDGAMFQWTAIGDGMMDVPAFTGLLRQHCPTVPLFVESISNSQRPLPFHTDEFWAGFPDVRASDIIDFLKLVRQGRPIPVAQPKNGQSQREFDQQHQRAEFERSIRTLRAHVS
ncbi:MAG: sugar phosphate isomerase/epimerase [Opitutaceae bacterium]|nr:sugar phosphate isomerase/epimerase [Opitutaceae bacterium]